MSVHVAVIHEHPAVLVNQLEYAGTFHGFGGLLQGFFTLAEPGGGLGSVCRGERLCLYLTDSAITFVLVEGVVQLIHRIVDDIHINGGLATIKEVDGVAFQVGKVLVRVVEEDLVVSYGPVVGQERVVNERASLGSVPVVVGVVPEGFGGPNAGHVGEILAFVAVREVYRAVFPVDQVLRLHEHHAAVARPTFGALHVGIYHVEPAIGGA